MNKISSKEIRDKFLEFFKENGHMELSDSSIIPKNDPTLLFINSGMAPLKDYFTGAAKPPCKRLCDVQTCIRTIDIDSIGDKHHLTSFQMLGSWSIGDYFKEKAIYFAYTLLTERIKLPKEKIYVSVFSGDEELGIPFDSEAYECWKKVGVAEDHIVKCGREDNFWGPTSETGPCGPCTEMFFDTGDGEEYIPGGNFDTTRYIEIWNAGVFMQFSKNADGNFSKLAFNSVDTGAGLERLAMVIGGHSSVYETDLLAPIREKIISQLDSKNALSEREILILTDHLRTTSIILSEKVVPSNEGRGYTPRKLIRRCMMITQKNKVYNFNFSKVLDFILTEYKDIFPHFEENHDVVIKAFEKEYEQFSKVLKSGLERLETIKGDLISAEDAFELVTTYGLPFDIIKQYAEEKSLKIDEEGFKNKIEIHKEKSRNISAGVKGGSLNKMFSLLSDAAATEFTGYENHSCEATIIKVIDGEELTEKALKGQNVGVVFDKSCFYAESGGQCADTGVISGENFKLKVTDVKKSNDGVFVHFCEVESGEIKLGDKAFLKIDEQKRIETECNHTAVHLLHSALRKIFGENVHQAGSKVESKKLRFDFNYENAIKDEEIAKIEEIVNESIRSNIKRNVEIKSLSEAVSSGAMALFESKYKDEVRVVCFGDVSKELCGGTHTSRTGNIGLFIILSAEGIGKGVKRITALTGGEALNYVQGKIREVGEISKIFKVKPENLIEKIKKEASKNDSKSEKTEKADLTKAEIVDLKGDFKLAVAKISELGKKLSSEIVKAAENLGGVFACICGEDKKQVMIAVANRAQNEFKANEILSDLMQHLNGKGGGNKKLATGGTSASASDIIENLKNICIK